MSSTILRVAPGLVAIGVLVAAGVLVGFRRRLVAKALIVGAGIYGAWAFGRGAVLGVSLPDVLATRSIGVVPHVLDSAMLGAFLILPIGWLVATIRAGIPRFRHRSHRLIVHQAVALTLCLALVAASMPRSSPSGINRKGAALAQSDRMKLLDNSMRAIEDADRDAPRDRWDAEYVVQAVGKDPQKLIEWVRDNTSWIPYHGVLRGPAGVLMDRRGNSLDRALLLATLLGSAGIKARLAHRTATAAEAAQVVAASLQASTGGRLVEDGDSATEVVRTAASYDLDAAPIGQMLNAQQVAGDELVRRLIANTTIQSTALLAQLTPADARESWDYRLDAAIDAARDHWWVQWFDGSGWGNARVTSLDDPARDAGSETFAADDLPHELQHTVTISVRAEYVDNGRIAATQVLTHPFAAWKIGSEPIVLQFWPGSWPSRVANDPNSKFGIKAAAIGQDDWGAILTVGQKAIETGVITRHVAASTDPDNPFAGIASSFARSMSIDRPRGELSAVWIDYVMEVPGDSPRRQRRYVFDLLGADRRATGAPLPPLNDQARILRGLALMMRTEILLVNASVAPEFVTHRAAVSMLGNRSLLRAILNDGSTQDDNPFRNELRHAAPPLSPLLVLALSRLAWSPTRDQIAIDRPNIFSRHAWPAIVEDQVVLRDAIDIVANDVAVGLRHPNSFIVRLRQGVFDTGLEAAVTSARPDSNVALAFVDADRWRTLTAANGVAGVSLPAAAKQDIADDLSGGYAVVAPNAPVAVGSGLFTGWWRIDPRTGTTLGINNSGWGGSLIERARLNALATTMIEGWAFEYGLCMGVPQIVNAAVIVNEALMLTLFGGRYVQPKDPGKLARGSNTMCLIQGIIAGAFATLPLLLMTVRAAGRGAGVLGRLARAGEVPPVSRGIPSVQPEPTVPGRSVDPLGNTEPHTQVSPQRPRGAPTDPEPRSPPEIKASRGSNDPALFGARYAQAQANYEAANAAGEKAWNEYWESSRQAANRGESRPPLPQELRDLARKSAEAMEDLEDLEAQKERILRDQNTAEKNANKAGVRDGDTQRSGQPPRTPDAPPPAGAPPPCPGDCDKTVTEMKTITGIGGAIQALGAGGG